MKLKLTIARLAVEQYQEKVKPSVDLDSAADELGRLLGMGTFSLDPPRWIPKRNRSADAYIEVGDDFVFAVVGKHILSGEGRVTFMWVRGELLPEQRRYRNKKHRHRRIAARMSSNHAYERRNAKHQRKRDGRR